MGEESIESERRESADRWRGKERKEERRKLLKRALHLTEWRGTVLFFAVSACELNASFDVFGIDP